MKINSDCGRIGRFWYMNSDTSLKRIPETNTDFVIWGSSGWGNSLNYQFQIFGETTDKAKDYFKQVFDLLNQHRGVKSNDS